MTLTKNIISIAGKIPFVKSLYYKSGIAEKREAKRIAYLKSLPREAYPAELKKWYKSATGHELNLENPQTFNEKIQWLKLYDSTPLKTKLADKYLVREWVAEKIGEEHLIPLLGVWDSFDEIDFDKLPDQFVLKTNHGCAYNLIVKDKSSFDKGSTKKIFEKWLSEDFGWKGFELHYLAISKKIIAEKYMEDKTGDLPDYKVLCFDGKAKYIWIDNNRYTNHTRNIYDLEWNIQPFSFNYPRSDELHLIPDKLNEIITLAEILSAGFSHVRVDFYVVNGGIYFGEMTFTTASGCGKFTPEEYDLKLGELIHLPK